VNIEKIRKKYLQKKKQIKNECEKKLKEIDFKFAVESRQFDIGDIIQDHGIKIQIAKIKWGYTSFSSDSPCCIYCGPILKKDNTPRKNGQQGCIYDVYATKI